MGQGGVLPPKHLCYFCHMCIACVALVHFCPVGALDSELGRPRLPVCHQSGPCTARVSRGVDNVLTGGIPWLHLGTR